MRSFKGSTCLACAWIFASPYSNTELNLTVSRLGFSMKGRQVLPDGLIIISGPFNLLSGLIENLKEIESDPYWFKLGRNGFVNEVQKRSKELVQELS